MFVLRCQNGGTALPACGVLLRPEIAQWLSWVRVNQASCGGSADRRRCSAELLECAAAYTGGCLGFPHPRPRACAPVIVTGHQPSWHHSGIWIKTLAGAKMAQALSGLIVHVVLDHDICDTALVVPHRRPDGIWSCRRLRVESGPAVGPLERRHPSSADIAWFLNEVTHLHPDQLCNALWQGYDVPDAIGSGRLVSLADVITGLQACLHVPFRANQVLYLPVSRLSATEAFLGFAAAILSNALYFSQSYNHALAQHTHRSRGRGELGIRALAVDSTRGQTELPFWLMRPDGNRTSLHVRHRGAGTIVLLAAAGEMGCLDASSPEGKARQLRQLLAGRGWMLRPKAIPLTLFLRLYLADWFIHGVGGARYEPITDHLIRDYYGIRPPHYGVATCTATLPRCTCPPPAQDPGQLRHRLHHLRHNPERCLEPAACRRGPVGPLLSAKQEQIARARDPRLSRAGHKAAWDRLAQINQQIGRYVERELVDLEQAQARAREEQASQAVCQNRGYFFGLFPEDRLHRLADAVCFSESASYDESMPGDLFHGR